jgi:hypothetical protein
MAVTHNRYTVGTALAQVVADSADHQEVWLQNLAPDDKTEAFARAGYLYLVASSFTLAASGTALFNIATAPDGMQIQFYELVSTDQPVLAELVEGATPTTGATVVSYNINREFPDDATTVFTQASALTGGSVISSELMTASKQGGGSMMATTKTHTLRGSEDYGIRFLNQANQETQIFVQIAFAEKFNGQNEVWVGDAVGTGVRIRGGETIHMSLIQGQKLFAVSEQDNDLMVTRQD